MKRLYVLLTVLFLFIALSAPAFAAKDILTSIHGRQIGLDVDGNLIVKQKQVTAVTAAAGSTGATNTTETTFHTAGLRSVKLTMAALDLNFVDQPNTILYGGAKIYDFPEGLILFLGAVIDGSLTVASNTAGPSFDGDVALGTITADNGLALTSNKGNLLTSAAMTQATLNVANCDSQSTATHVTETAASWINGATTAKDLYLNFLVDDDGNNTTGTGSFTGTIEFSYILLGNN